MMKNNWIDYLKWVRLLIGVLMVLFTPYYLYMKQINIILPGELIMTGMFSFFVFFLGLDYYFRKEDKKMSYFLMIFSIMMLMSVILGVVF